MENKGERAQCDDPINSVDAVVGSQARSLAIGWWLPDLEWKKRLKNTRMAVMKLTNFVADDVTISRGVAVVCGRLRRFDSGLRHGGDWAWLATATTTVSCRRAGRRERAWSSVGDELFSNDDDDGERKNAEMKKMKGG
ncbi:hypothetical protein AXF42_Ash015112 [Apostasia shenzhenica]|uniref:Uncharacterized protein n=1 Tax=Apostasia shenzhenica TaxID=1088818 RepID=A0A2I0AQI5_9ASPA|nr:hypothetical protein AXF42_Ash015112 [Apostasia shenzhenica]